MPDNQTGPKKQINVTDHAQVGVIGDHAHVEGGIHFHRQVIVYEGVKPVSAGVLIDACQAQVASILYDARHKYDFKLYVNRAIERDLCAFFDTPLAGPGSNCFLIVAPAGSGKTNLLCDLARVRVSRQPVLLLMGGSTYLSGTTGLLGAVKEELETASSEVAFRSAGDSLHTLHRLAEEMDNDALLFLDAINEHDRPVAMRQALEDLLRKTRNRRIKLVVTCRDYYWGLFKGRFWEGATVNGLPADDDVDKDDAGAEAEGFSRFAADEHERALDLYLEHYAISGRPVGDAAEQCRHPLLLRFFCEAYRGQDVGEIEDIRLKELFDRYWDQKLDSIAERMIKQGAERLQDGLAEEVGNYLLNVAAYMLHNNIRAVPLDAMSRATQCEEQYDDPRSVYGRIRDEFIILEEKERGKGQRKESQVAFVYEEFMEYVMARSLMRDWDRDSLDEAGILSAVEALTEKYEEFAQILGVMIYLALMLKEQRDLALWSLLLDKGERWQKVVFEAFRKLPESQLDAGIFDVLTRMLTTDDESIQTQVLDTLKVKRIGRAAPTSVFDALTELTKRKLSISRRTILALGNMPADLVLPVLEEALGDQRETIRLNALTALGRLNDPRANKLLFETFDKGKAANLRIKAAETLTKLGQMGPLITALENNRIGLVLTALEDNWLTAAEILDKLGDARVVQSLVVVLRDGHWKVRIIDVLGKLWEQLEDTTLRTQMVDALIAALGDNKSKVRSRAIEVLVELGDHRAVPSLIAVLKDSDAGVRAKAAWALGKFGDARAVDSLIVALRDRSKRVRSRAADVLARLEDTRAVPPLMAALRNDPIAGVRSKAAWALGMLGDARAVEPLIAALKDRDSSVRSKATGALRRIGTDEALAALRDLKAPKK
jgi:HEAT repeat protein